jgi:hypothetical protein
MEGGKKRLRGDVQREAGREEGASLKDENARLKWLGLKAATPVRRT